MKIILSSNSNISKETFFSKHRRLLKTALLSNTICSVKVDDMKILALNLLRNGSTYKYTMAMV